MCLSWTNTSLYYINCSLLSLYSRLDISFNHSTQFVSRTVTLCPPKWCDRGSSLCLSLADNITFCIPVRDYPLYLVEPSSHDLVHHRNWSPDKTSPWMNYCACCMITPAVALHSPNRPAHVLAKYIFYYKKGQEVVRCMGKGEPWYGNLVYLVAHPPTQCIILMTMTQVEMFHPNDSHAYAIDEVLQCLNQPCLTAEVSCLWDGLVWVGQIKKQLGDVHW